MRYTPVPPHTLLFCVLRKSSVPASLYSEFKERINIDPIEELRAGGLEETEEKVEGDVVEGEQEAEAAGEEVSELVNM